MLFEELPLASLQRQFFEVQYRFLGLPSLHPHAYITMCRIFIHEGAPAIILVCQERQQKPFRISQAFNTL